MVAAVLLVGCSSVPMVAQEPRERLPRETYLAPGPRADEPATPRAWLGVFLSDAVDGGVQVVALVPDGPAHRAGLLEGDLILEIDGRSAPNQNVLDRLIKSHGPGDHVELGLLRGGESLVVGVELGERDRRIVPMALRYPVPPEPPIPSDIPDRNRIQSRAPRSSYGLRVAEMTPALREHFGAPPDTGVLVLGTGDTEPAAMLGFRVGDVVIQLGERGIRDEDQLRWTLSTWTVDRPLRARVIRGGEPLTIELERPVPAVSPAAAPAPGPSPRAERELLESRLRAEIERLEERIRLLREELRQLQEQR
jgi:S1-C subfamily serine protease